MKQLDMAGTCLILKVVLFFLFMLVLHQNFHGSPKWYLFIQRQTYCESLFKALIGKDLKIFKNS